MPSQKVGLADINPDSESRRAREENESARLTPTKDVRGVNEDSATYNEAELKKSIAYEQLRAELNADAQKAVEAQQKQAQAELKKAERGEGDLNEARTKVEATESMKAQQQEQTEEEQTELKQTEQTAKEAAKIVKEREQTQMKTDEEQAKEQAKQVREQAKSGR